MTFDSRRQRRSTGRGRDLRSKVVGAAIAWAVAALIAVSAFPLADSWVARRQARQLLTAARQRVAAADHAARAAVRCAGLADPPLWRTQPVAPVLASWGNIGGCGVGGASSATGGVKWVGRGVSGGLVDVQCTTTQTLMLRNGYQSTVNLRLATGYFDKWVFAAQAPFRVNVQDVDVYGTAKTALLPGWGDAGVEVTRKLGMANNSSLTLSLNFPTGSSDAVRQGVVLPQQMQLGAGTLTGGLTFEHTQDKDWGLLIFGTSIAYGGWENSSGDLRGSSASAYLYSGFILGPFVPSLGLAYTTKFTGDRERYVRLPDQPMVFLTPSIGLEWTTDMLGLLLAFSAPLSLTGVESVGLSLGVQSSLF